MSPTLSRLHGFAGQPKHHHERQENGKIRHIAIRYHLVRKLALNRKIDLIFCVTEEIVADLLTKILAGATYEYLSARFYFLGF